MAKLNKEEQAYLAGLNKALKLVREGGQALLEKEVEFRGITTGLPYQISHVELSRLARKRIVPELRVMSTAIAYTLEYDLKLPGRTVRKFVEGFNWRIDTYRASVATLKADMDKLDKNHGLNTQVDKWCKMIKERGLDIDNEEE